MILSSNKKKAYCLEQVKGIKDEYSWKELNCFFRPFAICFHSINERYFELILLNMSMYMSFADTFEKDIYYTKEHNFFKYYETELKEIYGIDIYFSEFRNRWSIHRKIIEAILNDNIVVIPVDLFYLDYSVNYLEKHHPHYLIIKGFDSAKKMYYVLDNMHIDKGSDTFYSDFTISFKSVADMARGFKAVFDKKSYNPYMWTISSSRKNCESVIKDYFFYMQKVLKGLLGKTIKKEYVEKNIISLLKSGKYDVDVIDYLEKIRFRNVYYDLWGKLLAGDEIKSMSEKIINQWEELKYILINNVMHKKGPSHKLDECINNAIDMDIKFDKKVFAILSSNSFIEKEFVSYRRDGNILNKKNEIVFRIYSDRRYDIWQNIDEGHQQLFNLLDGENIFSASISIDTEFDSACQAGIILKDDNNNKLLAGICGRINFEILNPRKKSEFLLYRECIADCNNYELKVWISEDKKNAKIYSKRNNCWVKVYSVSLEIPVGKIGLFLRSWEKCDCKALFKNIVHNTI